MKKLFIVILAVTAVSISAQETIPQLDMNGVLKYYTGTYNGNEIMPFTYICLFGPDRLKFVRNEIFAKYGRPFVSRDLRSYFESTSWYMANPLYRDSMLTDTDRENVRRIQAFEHMSADFDGLLDYLKNGGRVSSKNGDLSAEYIKTDGNYKFSFSDDTYGGYPDYVEVSADALNNYKNSNYLQVYLIRFGDHFYLYYGEADRYGIWNFQVEFQYDPRTHSFYNVSFEEGW